MNHVVVEKLVPWLLLLGVLATPATAQKSNCAAGVSLYSVEEAAIAGEKFALNPDDVEAMLTDGSEVYREESLDLKIRYLELLKVSRWAQRNADVIAMLANVIRKQKPADWSAAAILIDDVLEVLPRAVKWETKNIIAEALLLVKTPAPTAEDVQAAIEERLFGDFSEIEQARLALAERREQVAKAAYVAKRDAVKGEVEPSTHFRIQTMSEFTEWRDSIKDPILKKKVKDIIEHIQAYGLDGVADKKIAHGATGVWSVRIHNGPGYRIYCAKDPYTGVIVLIDACPKPKEGRAGNYVVMGSAIDVWGTYLAAMERRMSLRKTQLTH